LSCCEIQYIESSERIHGQAPSQFEESQPRSTSGQQQGPAVEAEEHQDLTRGVAGVEGVAGKDLIIEFCEYDLNRVVADIEEIRRYNPQRFEMEQLTAIVHEDPARKLGVGYKDVRHDEFWARGHMPEMPIMPGVMMCESAAQLCSYLSLKYDLLGADVLGFGGMDEVRFRDPVYPGDRLVMVAQLVRVRRGAIVVSRFQGFVNQSLVCEGQIKGVPLPVALPPKGQSVAK
jgi:3-hydroxyacyl-[acyl-carrier-protein] dehydratase